MYIYSHLTYTIVVWGSMLTDKNIKSYIKYKRKVLDT